MSTRTIVETTEGQAEISTKRRWLYFIPMPNTGILPHPCRASEIKRGTFIKWTTNDASILAELHQSVARLVHEVGVAGMREIANSLQMTERVCKTFGGPDRIQDVVQMAARDGIKFPMPENVLKY